MHHGEFVNPVELLEPRRHLSTGAVDPTFGQGGVTTITDDEPVDMATIASVALPGGRVLLLESAGGKAGDTDYRFALVRLRADGSPDASFAPGGVLPVPMLFNPGPSPRGVLPGPLDQPAALAVDGDGRIYVGGLGYGYDDPVVARFHADGSPDRSFGNGGYASPDVAIDVVNTIALTADGKILLGGATKATARQPAHFAIARLKGDGTADASFGRGGVAVAAFAQRGRPIGSTVRAMTLDAAGRILAAGGDAASFDLARFTSAGKLDATFGSGGEARLSRATIGRSLPDQASFDALAVGADGSVFAGGGSTPDYTASNDGPLVVAKFSSRGRLDASFGSAGVIVAHPGAEKQYGAPQPGSSEITGLAALPGGGLLVSGNLGDALSRGVLLARLNADGTADASFGRSLSPTPSAGTFPAGWRLYALEADAGVGGLVSHAPSPGLVALPGGRFFVGLAAGRAVTGSPELGGVRLNADGSIDRTFGSGGVVIASATAPADLQPVRLVTAPTAEQPTILLTGSNNASRADAHLLSADGNAQTGPSFGSRGTPVAVQPDGKVLVTMAGANAGYLLRYNADGTLDTTWGRRGAVRFDDTSASEFSVPKVLFRGGDGDLVLDVERHEDLDSIERLSPSGRVMARHDLGSNFFDMGDGTQYSDMALAPDGGGGGVVVALQSGIEGTLYMGALRLDGSDLAPDPSFGTNGEYDSTVLLHYEIGDPASVHVAADGSVLLVGAEAVSGSPVSGEQSADGVLLRLTAAGVPDVNFGSGGVVRPAAMSGLAGARQIAFDAQGRMLVAGESSRNVIRVTRLMPDGSVDPAFGSGGSVVVQPPTGPRLAGSLPVVAMQPTAGGGEELVVAAAYQRPEVSIFNNGDRVAGAFIERLELA